ncbi:MAG: hypothetical protein K2M36_00705 [Clostridia bacterium]|nr:hypothetical protein [Clostridia bacterium]
MEKFAVIDVETNWYDQVMSIGVVIAEEETFSECEIEYYVLEPECLVGGMYSDVLVIPRNLNCDTVVCSKQQAISDLLDCLKKNQVTKIFAYNAGFDYKHLPELHSFAWYDIMRLAAYRQYNSHIKEEDCFATGRLKKGYRVDSMKKLLTGLDGEDHNALCDALDELNCIMKPLGHRLEDYIQYVPQNKIAKTRNVPNKNKSQFKLTVQCDVNTDRSAISNPALSDVLRTIKVLKESSENCIILERIPNMGGIQNVKIADYKDDYAWAYLKINIQNSIYSFRTKLSESEIDKFIFDFLNDRVVNIVGDNLEYVG